MKAPEKTPATMRRNPESIAIETLQCALSWEPEARLVGNVMACEIALLAASQIKTCPQCGAEAWCNIDCNLCTTCSQLLEDGAT